MNKIFILILIFLLSFNIAYAKTTIEYADYIFTNIFGFPSEWLSPPQNMIYYGIVPFCGVWMIIYGFLITLKIFGSGRTGLYIILSFFIAFSTLPLRVFTYIVSTIFAAMGVFAVAVFAIMFFGGAWLLKSSFFGSMGWGYGKLCKKIDKLEKKILKNKKKIAKLDIENKPEDKAKAESLTKENEFLEEKLKELKIKREQEKSKRELYEIEKWD